MSQTSTVDFATEKKTPLKSLAKWLLKLLLWFVFVIWVAIIFFYPFQFTDNLSTKWTDHTKGTLFGATGSIFIAFSAPVLILVFLATLYLNISGENEVQEKKSSKCPTFRLRTFPILVDGPFGVVSAAEFIVILLFALYVISASSSFGWHTWTHEAQSLKSSLKKSHIMLDYMGADLGLIGLLCIAFLFLPVSRGSLLLRLIDIPFEHATRYHVWLGHLTMWLCTLHGLLYVILWTMEGKLVKKLLEWSDKDIANLPGVISLGAGLLMWVTSLKPVRKWSFELFFYTHHLYVIFVIFLALHVGDQIFCFGAGGIFLFMLDRFLRFIQSRKTVDIISATSLPCGTLELVISKPANLRYNALSFIFLRFRELSWLQWHPFSVSSSPLDGKHHISILIKVLGKWTENLKEKLSNKDEETHKLQESQLKSLLTASVEGPYGHVTAYHFTYKHLVLVAGGIGISPFLAVLSDIFHRLKQDKPCMTRNILIIWAIKKSDELPILSMLNKESLDPILFDVLNLEIQIYITRESTHKVDEGKKLLKPANSCIYPNMIRSGISVFVGTSDNLWSGIYVIASSLGFIVCLGLLDAYYINPRGIDCLWYKGLLLVMCMAASVVVVGGFVVTLWHLWEKKMVVSEEHEFNHSNKSNKMIGGLGIDEKDSGEGYLASCRHITYGRRPDFKEIFESTSESWGAVDVGVLVCGPPTLQSSLARAIQSHSLKRKKNYPIFHFNSHSFDL